MNNKFRFLQILGFLIAIFIAFLTGFYTHSRLFPTTVQFPVLSEVYQLIQDHGYKVFSETPAMEHGAIRGMINAYGDPHTHFMEPVQAELNNDSLSGEYGGIGAEMGRDSQGNIILHPFPESPAAAAGVKDGDRLVKIDTLEITNETSMDEIVAVIRGPIGQTIQLFITRSPDYHEMEFAIERTHIPLPSVSYHLGTKEPRLGVIRVNIIASSTPDEIMNAVRDLQSRNASNFALDLRGNGGGLLNEGVDIARLFLKEGIVIEQQYVGENIETFKVKKPGPLVDVPLVVFVNENTASAAEIISGALQNHDRAPLIGSHTYGKDSIQLVFELQDRSSLHVTSAKWWIPGLEHPVGEGGLRPDYKVSTEIEGDTDPFIDAAILFFFGE